MKTLVLLVFAAMLLTASCIKGDKPGPCYNPPATSDDSQPGGDTIIKKTNPVYHMPPHQL